MKRTLVLVLCLPLLGCETMNMKHYGGDGSLTNIQTTSFLTRGHTRIEKVASNNPEEVKFAEPYVVPNTASNDTGLGGWMSALLSFVKRPTTNSNDKQQTTTRDLQPMIVTTEKKPEAFLFDHDSDSEPAVRVFRIGTVGAVTAYITK